MPVVERCDDLPVRAARAARAIRGNRTPGSGDDRRLRAKPAARLGEEGRERLAGLAADPGSRTDQRGDPDGRAGQRLERLEIDDFLERVQAEHAGRGQQHDQGAAPTQQRAERFPHRPRIRDQRLGVERRQRSGPGRPRSGSKALEQCVRPPDRDVGCGDGAGIAERRVPCARLARSQVDGQDDHDAQSLREPFESNG